VDLKEFQNFINNTSFPVLACIGMGWLYYKTIMPLQMAINKLANAISSTCEECDLKHKVRHMKDGEI
jgi:hypothetical protein